MTGFLVWTTSCINQDIRDQRNGYALGVLMRLSLLLCAGFISIVFDALPEWENLHGEGKKGQLSEGGRLG